MQEILDDTHDQEDHGEGQAGNGKDTQKGQAGISGVEHRNQIGDGLRDPAADGIEHIQNLVENSSSSMRKHLIF